MATCAIIAAQNAAMHHHAHHHEHRNEDGFTESELKAPGPPRRPSEHDLHARRLVSMPVGTMSARVRRGAT